MIDVQADKNSYYANPDRVRIFNRSRVGWSQRREPARPDDGWFCRETLSGGLRPLSCQRRVGVDPGRERRKEHRILVNLLADRTQKSMGALGYRCSSINPERPQGLVDPP